MEVEGVQLKKRVECRNADSAYSYQKNISPSATKEIIIEDVYRKEWYVTP